MTRPPFELRILGPTELYGPDPEAADAFVRQPKRLAILAYLALASIGGFRRRDQVIAMFWPELDQAAGRTNLRKALHGIRESLGVDFVIARGEDELRVDRDQLACDAVAMQERVADGRWSDALALYRGELLEGLFPEGVAQEFHDWLSAQRRALREQAARAAWECATLEESRGDRTAAAVMARRARELDPDNEEGVRRLMELLDRRGDRGSALRVYAEWQARMLEEFGVEPAPETRKAARRIQAARKGESHETPAMMPVEPPLPNAAVSRSAVMAPGAPLTSVAPAVPQSRWRPWAVVSVALIAVAVVMAVIAGRPREGAAADRSITLSPLRAIGGPAANDIASDLSEVLATELARDTAITVRVPRAGITNASASTPTTAFATDGAVSVARGRIRITVRLLRVNDGLAIWAGTYHLDADDSGLEEVVADAVNEIRARVSQGASAAGGGDEPP